MLLLVRHAHAGAKHHWPGPDRLRPLSPAGLAEAAGLVVRLDDYPVGRILSSPTVRCQQTVQPLAHDRRLPIEPTPALGVAAELVQVLALLDDPGLADAVLCTHGELLGRLLGWLVADGLVVEGPLTWPKGSTWLLEGAGGRFAVGRYLPPLSLPAALPAAASVGAAAPRPGSGGLHRVPLLGEAVAAAGLRLRQRRAGLARRYVEEG